MRKYFELEKPVESDSESAEDGASSSDSGSESEAEKVQIAKLPPVAPKKSQHESSAKVAKVPVSSSSDDGSETESGEPISDVKPIAFKPFDNPPKSTGGKNPRSKPNASDAATRVKSTGAKRPAEDKESQAKDTKKSKKQQLEPKVEVETLEKKSNDNSKKQLFQRLWSEDDEVVILTGMIDYSEKKKLDPVADLDSFHDFIKGDLHIEVTNTQLLNKMRRLKKKFENNKMKEKDGKERVFSNPHEHKAYELSKEVWGNAKVKERGSEKLLGSSQGKGKSARKSQKKRANNEVENGQSDEMNVDVAKDSGDEAVTFSSGMEEEVLRSGAELFRVGGKTEQERAWRKLKINEMEVYLKKLDLMRTQTKLVLDILKSDR